MKKLTIIVMLLAILLCGCETASKLIVVQADGAAAETAEKPARETAQNPSTAPATEQTVGQSSEASAAPVKASYERFEGSWINSDLAQTRYDVWTMGGQAIQFESITGDNAKGNIICIGAAPGNREAMVEFDGRIIEDVLKITYQDDGWGNSGEVTIRLTESKLYVAMAFIEIGENANWNIGVGEFEFTREIVGS